MSHYSVAVFHFPQQSIEDLLAPYDENLSVPRYISKSGIIADVRKHIEEYKDTVYAEYLKNPKDYVDKCGDDPRHIKYVTKEFPKKLHWTDEECYLDGLKNYSEREIMPDGSVFTEYNPNSKWDWYEIGGRYSEIVPLVDGRLVNESEMKNVNIHYVNTARYLDSLRFWQLYIDGEEPISLRDEELLERNWYTKEYYIERYDSAKEYANWVSGFNFYAALLPSGEWLEPGEMGWFGMSAATPYDMKVWRKKVKEIIERAKEENWTVTIVDCHI